MTSAIMNPLHAEEMHGVMGADVLTGNDAELPRAGSASFREARRADGRPAAPAQPATAPTRGDASRRRAREARAGR